MTYRECAIVQAYTGTCMLSGDALDYYYEYVNKIMGRPLHSYEIFVYIEEIKEKSRKDFIDLCRTAVKNC